jgi:multidrug efflux pump subunit AcrA (membrane-fusion protein)
MKNKLNSFGDFVKSHKIWSFIILIGVILIAWYFIKNNSENIKYTEISVVRGSLSEIVSVTGNVKPLSDVNLAFERGGRVANISVAVGDKVYTGENLASVSNADLLANLAQAEANLKKVKAGQGDSSLKTNLDFSQAEISLVNAIKDSYTKADDAVRNKLFSLFINPVKYRARLAFNTDTFLQEDIEEGKDDITESLDSWSRSLIKLSSASNLEIYYNEAKLNLTNIKKLLEKSAEAVNGLSPESGYITQTQIDTWKLNISTARTSVNTAIDTLTNYFDQYKTADLAVKISQNSALAEEASVEQAAAGVASAQAELAKSIIKSPIAGVITNIDAKLGEIVSANKNVISVISYGEYQVESFIPEADIAKVKIGNLGSTTLDAYGDSVVFETTVIKIDPAATVIDDVPTYKVTLKFVSQDERIKSGMTANLDILTNQKDNILVLPNRLIITKEGEKYVSVIDPTDQSDLLEIKIVTGLRGSDGNVEIISGLNEGDKVVAQ